MAWCDPIIRKLNLANWQMVCKPKRMGGLCIMDLRMFNKALLEMVVAMDGT